MSGFTPTPQQHDAITYRGGELLVSAAAGSGKTKVLVERLLSYVTDDSGCDIDDFLIITYTRAAAAELREKILDEISERLATNPGNRRLRRQSGLVHRAKISTIHSFCADLLRENAHLVGLSPDFRVTDESESGIIKAAVLDDVLSDAYDGIRENPGFLALADMLATGRDDRRLVAAVLDAHTKLLSHPSPSKWAEEQSHALALDGVSDVSETVWGRLVINDARRTAEYWLSEMRRAREEMRSCPDLEKGYGDSFSASIAGIEAFITALSSGWDAARLMRSIEYPRGRASGYEDIKEVRTRCKKAMDKIAGEFECTSDELIGDMQAVYPAVSALLELVLTFDVAYSKEKRRRGVVDFSDQEHMTLALLYDAETGEKTELARTVSKRFKEIMIDEYQDVNAVQELIFSAVSRDNANVFMVGDVKQSIYRFRLADPSIFLGKYERFTDEPAQGVARRILLQQNFRSRPGVLNAVNYVFAAIMSKEFGEMDYTEREYLWPGREDTQTLGAPVELNVIDMAGIESDDDSPEKIDTEAEFIARRIEELVAAGNVRYSDFAILLRSVRDRASRYAAALARRGIPADVPGGEGFFETEEIRTALAILSVVDNPMQDIPLIAAMQSPVYGFMETELAEIRAAAPDGDFYAAVTAFAQSDGKCREFIQELDDFRELAPDLPSDRLIWHIYNRTGLPGVYGAMRGGAKRRENLMALITRARTFEQNGYRGLFIFLTYLRRMIERGGAPETESGVSGDAVKIMSVHKSKGLEFPVVFLADTSKRLNNQDTMLPLLIHPALGVGAQRVDRERGIEYPTLARVAVRKQLTAEMMAEELRVLYVAMTRAREKLIITSTFRDARRELEKLAKGSGYPVSPQALIDARSLAGWILLPALTRPEAAALRGDVDAPKDNVPSSGEWDIRFIDAVTPSAEPGAPSAMPERHEENTAPLGEDVIKAALGFMYPHALSPLLPSKLTVTELKGRMLDLEVMDEAEPPRGAEPAREEKRQPPAPYSRPRFITDRSGLTGAERGTALHLAMQYIDFSRCTDLRNVNAELDRLAERRLITPEQRTAVDAAKITAFFNCALGRQLLDAGSVRREFKYSLLYPAETFYPGAGDDKILVQGVIDCYFEDLSGVTVLDFKTDYVTAETIAGKARMYAPQLTAYADALKRITGRDVTRRVIYFFATEEAVEV